MYKSAVYLYLEKSWKVLQMLELVSNGELFLQVARSLVSESPREFDHDNSRVPPRDLESESLREEEEETSNQHFLQNSAVVLLHPAGWRTTAGRSCSC